MLKVPEIDVHWHEWIKESPGVCHYQIDRIYLHPRCSSVSRMCILRSLTPYMRTQHTSAARSTQTHFYLLCMPFRTSTENSPGSASHEVIRLKFECALSATTPLNVAPSMTVSRVSCVIPNGNPTLTVDTMPSKHQIRTTDVTLIPPRCRDRADENMRIADASDLHALGYMALRNSQEPGRTPSNSLYDLPGSNDRN